MRRLRKGQSTLEYIIVFTAIVVAVLAFAYTPMRQGVQRLLDRSRDKIQDSADDFTRDTTLIVNPAPAE